MRSKNKAAFIGKIIVLVALAISAMGLLVQFLWNWLIPEIFHGTTITFLQSIGLLVLAKLFIGFGAWGKNYQSKKHYQNNFYWKKKWEGKMNNMTEEEKEQFKKMYYDRCGWNSWDDAKTSAPAKEQEN